MIVSKQLLLLTTLLLSVAHLNGLAPVKDAAINQLDRDMRDFRHRAHIYVKCLRGKCTPEERKAANETVLKDGTILVGSLLALGLAAKYGWPKWKLYRL